MATPYLTITRALASGRPQILVATGTYAESLTFGTGRIWGGYEPSTTWTRGTTRSVVSGAVVVDGDGGFVTLDTLSIEAPTASLPGESSIALTIRNVDQGAVLNRLQLSAGAGAQGLAGAPGGVVTPGIAGDPGGQRARWRSGRLRWTRAGLPRWSLQRGLGRRHGCARTPGGRRAR